jgi:hypothetical protein
MMKLVNHASSEIHRIYRRVSVGDAARYVDLIPIPTDGPSKELGGTKSANP